MSAALLPPPAAPCTHAALETAAAKLTRSETGQEAARLLHRFLRGAGGRLDSSNQNAVMVLLAAAFGPCAGTVLNLLSGAASGAPIVNDCSPDEL